VEGRTEVNSNLNAKKPTLLLADDHAIVLDGLRRLLEREFDLVGCVGDGWALLEAARKLKPDVIVSDVSMPMLNGIEAVRRLKKSDPRCKFVMLSMHGEIEIAKDALSAGASAYVIKHSAAETLSHAIWEAINGRVFISPRIARSMAGSPTAPKKAAAISAVHLTQREREVLQLVAEGRTINGIASILKIAARTVVFHKSNLMDKLGRRTTADLTQYAIQSGIIDVRVADFEGVFQATA